MFTRYRPPASYITQIRNVALLPGERVSHIFGSHSGLVVEPPGNGQLLVTTNQRILSFSQGQSRNELTLAPIEELKGVTLKGGGARDSGSLLQGVILVIGGILLYLVLAYWMAGRFDGPTVPVINVDVAPLIVLLIIASGFWLVGKYYFARSEGSVTFQGSNWVFVFPFEGDKAGKEIYGVVNAVFANRQSQKGYSFLWDQ